MVLKIKNILNLQDCSNALEESLMEETKFFCMNVTRLWKASARCKKAFETKHTKWLNNTTTFKRCVDQPVNVVQCSSKGRPKKEFSDISQKSKIRRVDSLVQGHGSDELCFAAERSMRLSQPVRQTKCLSSQQALALFYDLKLSVRKYGILRSVVNSVHENCFPSYHILKQTKIKYLPKNIEVNEVSAKVDLQEILEKTTESILNKTDVNIFSNSTNLKLQCKWGFDGSSGHSVYKQKFEDLNSSDEYMFLVAFVPLKLIDDNGKIIWNNPKSSSTLYCRPIKFIFHKENADLVREEQSEMNKIIDELKVFEYSFCNTFFKISFQMIFTMFDGSVSNILSETNSTSKCIVCGATPKEMNLDLVLNKPPKTENYRFGLSTLHCWIRFFECLIHIAYRLPFKTWQVKGEENKEKFNAAKKQIQEHFKSRMGLIVDKPKPGCGSTNDGNTARRFFSNVDLSSEITKIDKELILKFSVILRVLVSGCNINLIKFKTLLEETRSLYIQLYGWYYMPSTVHKVLVHGCDIIEFFELPIGQLSEDALEARHKEFRQIRLCNSRKISRSASNTDIIKTLIITSDPEIATYRHVSGNKKNVFWSSSDIEEFLITEENSASNVVPMELPISSESDEEFTEDSDE